VADGAEQVMPTQPLPEVAVWFTQGQGTGLLL
jgi:hypothetical protein